MFVVSKQKIKCIVGNLLDHHNYRKTAPGPVHQETN